MESRKNGRNSQAQVYSCRCYPVGRWNCRLLAWQARFGCVIGDYHEDIDRTPRNAVHALLGKLCGLGTNSCVRQPCVATTSSGELGRVEDMDQQKDAKCTLNEVPVPGCLPCLYWLTLWSRTCFTRRSWGRPLICIPRIPRKYGFEGSSYILWCT